MPYYKLETVSFLTRKTNASNTAIDNIYNKDYKLYYIPSYQWAFGSRSADNSDRKYHYDSTT
jgi:hypothetical protein